MMIGTSRRAIPTGKTTTITSIYGIAIRRAVITGDTISLNAATTIGSWSALSLSGSRGSSATGSIITGRNSISIAAGTIILIRHGSAITAIIAS